MKNIFRLLKNLFKQKPKPCQIKDMQFRISAFEAMSLSIHGKQDEALKILKEVDKLYAELNQ